MTSRKTPIKWNKADFKWNDNSFTWDDVQLLKRAAGEDWNTWEQKDKKKLVKLILKIYGDTITESKQKEIKQYKITAKDIRIAVKEVSVTKMIAENVSI
tara:strand:+ start:2768 stop:3064 length:297 start_codon:yes stop_codon:yes gene_type:complete